VDGRTPEGEAKDRGDGDQDELAVDAAASLGDEQRPILDLEDIPLAEVRDLKEVQQ
jgi:hypothetical protein